MLDVTGPADPVQVGQYGSMSNARRATVAGSYAYVATGSSCELRVVDIANPVNPREVGIYDANGGYAWDMAVSGNYAYLATYGGRYEESLNGFCALHVVDISDPTHPTRVAGISTDGAYREIAVVGDIVYVADEWGLRIISVADPTAPVQIGFIRTFHETRETVGIAVSGTLAYLAASMGGVVIVDVSDPSNLTIVGECDLQDFTLDVAVGGNIVYAACADGLYIVDVSNPETPTEIAYYNTPGVAYGVTVIDNVAYVSDGGAGVQALDVSNPSAPTLIEAWDIPGFAYNTTLNGNHAYVADGNAGLIILEKSNNGTMRKHAELQPPTYHGRVITYAAGLGGQINLRHRFTNRALRRSRIWAEKTTNQARRRIVQTGTDSFTGLATQPFGKRSDTAGTCVVISAADSGSGTLRQCLESANIGDTITFDPMVFPPTSPVTISLITQLPSLAQGQLIIDASDAGVILDGTNTPPGTVGLYVDSSGNTIKGFQVLNFPAAGIEVAGNNNTIGGDRSVGGGPTGEGNVISGNDQIGLKIYGSDNAVQGNLIGIDATGSVALGNTSAGLQVEGARNIVGGIKAEQKNVISGNDDSGIHIQGADAINNTVIGNFIGTDVTGTNALGNNAHGLCIASEASHNKVGGTTPEERNIISGNRQAGVELIQKGVEGNVIVGNYIGTDVTGTKALGNGDEGVSIEDGPINNVIGGTNPGERNIISGNNNSGVSIGGAVCSSQNTVIGNFIGTDVTGTAALGNDGGVGIWSYGFNRIGGEADGERNIVSGNTGPGIGIGGVGPHDNLVIGNYIGTDVSGTQAIGNHKGVCINEGMRHNFVGGTTDGERNLISGNVVGVDIAQAGIEYNWITGNYIGTNASGTAALGNDYAGVLLEDYASHNLVQENLISGNIHTGVRIQTSASLNLLRANRIGIAADGASPIPNGTAGVRIEAASNTVGGLYLGDCNTIAYNIGGGIEITSYPYNNIIGNSIHSHTDTGISVFSSSNIIYHNNIINNTIQAYDEGSNSWDNGYPSGGNYWSDYTGMDANGDGIGDIPYYIGPNGIDRYPLMSTKVLAVSSTSPANDAAYLALNTPITATFSEAMDPSSITTDAFLVNDGSGNIAGSVTYSDTTATFTPTTPLDYSTEYTATITTGAKNLAGIALKDNHTWSFTTQPEGVDGDVAPLGNRDGTINVGDALVALRFALGLEKPTQEDIHHGDVAPLTGGKPSPDGLINVGDALVILRKALGIVSF